ncbi:NADH-quinone oxidoreductase subunit N [Lachnospiraceae bacterium]|nr:sodium:proton antiporter [Eubacterium sp.]GFI25961.1 NADH-quinone oxidoreductase subunit N [Lachnospiraceae bacterium]
MEIIRNFPCLSILLAMFSAIISSALKGNGARRLNTFVVTAVGCLSAATLYLTYTTGESYVYVMGHFPAPFGNEIRFGSLEAGMALFFCVIMLFSLNGGRGKLRIEVDPGKENLYYIMVDLLLSSLLALVYTNDLFTAYVFVEINTIAACGLIMIMESGRAIEAATRYMIMSLLGSGLFLIGLCMLYDMTGHLLMSYIQESVREIAANGTYMIPLLVTIALIVVGLAIKSALFPFHAWLPDAYGYSTVSSAAMLSSLVSKGYIFLLIKIIYRVIGFDIFVNSRIINVLFVFGLAGMIMGSTSAIRENDIRRMISYSSVAQIGYIYMGFGLGTTAGMVASVFHILSHAATKSLLFVSGVGLTDVSGEKTQFIELTGSAYRNVAAGLAFTVGSLSMVGIPLFSGFISKLLFSQAAVQSNMKMLPALIVLAVSTVLNAIYFMKTVIRIYTPMESRYPSVSIKKNRLYAFTLLCFMVLNVVLGMCSQPITDWITQGLSVFA